ncbi:MAG: isochorismate synthase [Tannerellaceae bacterium]|jgi:isochorismate synthase|nr:isochorismate synthase [Tannerellaceae bacterium]
MTPDISLDSLIEENRNFAIYRIPGSNTLHFVSQERGQVSLLRGIEELNGQSGFVIAPFEISESCPIALLQPDREERIPVPEGETFSSTAAAYTRSATVEAGYADRFRTFIAPIREKRFKKLVLSRETIIGREEAFSPAGAFLIACRKYIRSYVYLFHTPATGTWMGCTPEILLAGEKNRWHTVALAGTQPLCRNTLPDTWDDKNLIEQMLVAYYIRMQLFSFGIHPEENGPYTVRAGDLAHLKTDFHFSLPDTGRLGDLLKLLHPTPAVSGLPKEEARRFILANEGYDRRYYSGFAGWLEPQGKSDLYVNLRCMNIQPHALRLYAGGGLLPSSGMEEEWQETEDKLQTMLFVTKRQNTKKQTYVFG